MVEETKVIEPVVEKNQEPEVDKKVKKHKRIKLKDRTPENDIKFKPFVSYRHLRILGWLFLALSQVSVILKIAIKLDSSLSTSLNNWLSFFTFFTSFSLPLFLLANFAIILQGKNNYKNLLIKNGALAALMYALGNLITLHYGHGLLSSVVPGVSVNETMRLFGVLFSFVGQSAYVFNIFIDLFLCSLIFFFMNYNPKKVFVGKKKIIFRLFVLLPILYEVGSIVLKSLALFKQFQISSFVFFLLTSKPPMMFLAFVLLVIAMKVREVLHIRRHQSVEHYENYLKTNAHQLRLSIGLSIIFFVVATIDLLVFIIVPTILTFSHEVADEEEIINSFMHNLFLVNNLGFGNSIVLYLLIPIVLCFSYTKTYKNKKIDIAIPAVGIAIVAFVYVEGLFQILVHNAARFSDKLLEFIKIFIPIDGESGGGDATSESSSEVATAIITIKNAISRIYF